MRLAGKAAVITGGASGIGLATALRFLEEGASVVIADFNESAGREAVAEAESRGFGGKVAFVRADVAREEDVEAMLADCLERYGSLDILFNNAGVGGSIGPLTEISVEDWDYTMNVLARGVFLGIKHAARIMRRRGEGGSILNTASVAALSGDAGPLVYSAAKAAVVSLTKSAAVDLAADRIRVNAICPGLIATPLAESGRPEQTRKAFASLQPWPEHGRSEDIAGAALFLASDDSGFVTGEALVVDGGLSAAGPNLSMRQPHLSARNADVSGVTKGTTGEPPDLRKLQEMLEGPFEGGCQCEAIQYRCDAPPFVAYTCHCLACQRLTSSAFATCIQVPAEALSMVQGSPAFRVRTSDRGNALETAFCGICSTALYSGSSARPRIRTIYVGTLDRAADVEVRAHIWTR